MSLLFSRFSLLSPRWVILRSILMITQIPMHRHLSTYSTFGIVVEPPSELRPSSLLLSTTRLFDAKMLRVLFRRPERRTRKAMASRRKCRMLTVARSSTSCLVCTIPGCDKLMRLIRILGDTTRIANTVSGAYFIYSAPFEILVASIFLYK